MRTAQRHQLADPPTGLAALPAPDRRRVIAAATEVFVSEGYGATTREQLQRQIYPRIFDSLFAAKEDCFVQVFDHLTAQAREEIAASTATGESWPRRLATGLRTLLELVDAQPAAARLVLVEAQVATPDIYRRFFDAVKSAEPFMREGRLLADERMPALTDSVLPGGIAGALAEHLNAGREAPVASLYGELLLLLLSYFRNNPEVAAFLSTDKSSLERRTAIMLEKSAVAPHPCRCDGTGGPRSFPGREAP